MKLIILITSLLALTLFDKENKVKTFGFYSNEKSYDGNHSIGYTLQLWKYQGTLIGQLSYNEAAIGSDVKGFITNVNYNSSRNLLSFDAILNKEKISFSGKILPTKVLGAFKWPKHIDQNQALKSCCTDAEINIDYPTLDKWKKMWQRFRY